jgi:hypothetical protein
MDITYVNEFENFVSAEVAEAAKELDKLTEQSRKHLQKLTYTNLVDRFDVMIDKTIISNALHESLLDDCLKQLDTPITEANVLRLLMDGRDINQVVEERVKSILRNGVLRNRHSLKLQKLFEVVGEKTNVFKKPRVNISTGKISQDFTPQNNKVPTSICGYADWLYSRRNAVVHGGGTGKMSEIDLAQLKKLYGAKVVATTRIKLNAITVASEFYLGIVKMLKDAASTDE